ncbi:MAG: peptidoglycan editing factor PgeF [Mariprofundus sp.]|nr:peptidoglycan editing factor PgeF [Mariprofundus sp.]
MAEPGFIHSELFSQHGIIGLFTLRHGGISQSPFDSLNFGLDLGDDATNIDANLNTLIQSAKLPGAPHQAQQVHQCTPLWCQGVGNMHDTEADILLTDQHNTPLAVRTADCLPILLADPYTGITAAVHAGWRGTAQTVAKQAIQHMCERGAKAGHILASLGPCIGSCCFTIEEDTAIALKNSAESAADFVQKTADLRQINRLQLRQCGLIDTHIECMDACTVCDAKRFFSFRRDAGNTGRHLAIVSIVATACTP